MLPRQGVKLLLVAAAPIALGHLASVAMVAVAALQGVPGGLHAVLGVMAFGLALLAAGCLHRHRRHPARARLAGLVLGSCFVTTLHGAGLALVPALLPLCLPAAPGHPAWRNGALSAALWPLLAACALHTAVMLVAGGVLAGGVKRVMALMRGGAGVRLSASTSPTAHHHDP
ncbi:MAG: hypothetical protein KF891_25345 [Rhizobacter sp.]|nr:hypothetical protein [Rhizobacter sp.]